MNLLSTVEKRTEVVTTLSEYPSTQPHTPYGAFTRGLSSKYNYFLHVMDVKALSTSEVLRPLESAIPLIPALTGQDPPGHPIWKLTALPVPWADQQTNILSTRT